MTYNMMSAPKNWQLERLFAVEASFLVERNSSAFDETATSASDTCHAWNGSKWKFPANRAIFRMDRCRDRLMLERRHLKENAVTSRLASAGLHNCRSVRKNSSLQANPPPDTIDAIDEAIAYHALLLDALQPNAPGRIELRWQPTLCGGREPYLIKLLATTGDDIPVAEILSDRFFPLRRERRGAFARTSQGTRVVLFQLQSLLLRRTALAASAKTTKRKRRRP